MSVYQQANVLCHATIVWKLFEFVVWISVTFLITQPQQSNRVHPKHLKNTLLDRIMCFISFVIKKKKKKKKIIKHNNIDRDLNPKRPIIRPSFSHSIALPTELPIAILHTAIRQQIGCKRNKMAVDTSSVNASLPRLWKRSTVHNPLERWRHGHSLKKP